MPNRFVANSMLHCRISLACLIRPRAARNHARRESDSCARDMITDVIGQRALANRLAAGNMPGYNTDPGYRPTIGL